jgi:5-methylcytosine-specific restriction enzyme subunit McrC
MTHPFPICELTEWKTEVLSGVFLAAADRQLAASLIAGEAGRLDIEELREGVRIRARSWIGVIRFQNFEVRITPKLAGGSAGVIQMLALTNGLDALRRNRGERTLDPHKSMDLLDLIALLFVEACEKIIQGGLWHDYVEQEADLPVLRGRILVGQQVRQHYGRIDRLACRYDDHITDVVENQILVAALAVCRNRVRHPMVRLHVHRLHTLFAAACTPEKLTDFKSTRANLIYHRLNEHYRKAHKLAWVLLEAMGVDDLLKVGHTASFAFLLDMNQLFENFMAHFVVHALQHTNYRVLPQKQDRSIIWDAYQGQSYTHIRPDLLIERTDGRRLTLDAKYKLYGERRLSPADMYQSFLYAYAYNDTGQQQPAAVLLYPASEPGNQPIYLQIRGHDRTTKAHLQALPISIREAIRELNSRAHGPVSQALRACVEYFIEGDNQ